MAASSRTQSSTMGAWAVMRAASAARATADAASAKKYMTTGATRDSGSLSSCAGSWDPANGWCLYCAVASARATLAEMPTHCPVALP